MSKEDINEILSRVNAVWGCGDFSIQDEPLEELRKMFGEEITEDENGKMLSEEIMEGDVVIYYNYTTDLLSDEDAGKLSWWLYHDPKGGWMRIIREMDEELGYEQLDHLDIDGSGGGLYYGCAVFRKIV